MASGAAGRSTASHLALVTECFLSIARDEERGGVGESDPDPHKAKYLRVCWLGAVYTTMTMVKSTFPVIVAGWLCLGHVL